MKKIGISILVASALIISCAWKSEKTSAKPDFSTQGKEVKIFTTAQNSTLRLTLTNTKEFSQTTMPAEVDASIFVNPKITFQSILGIGGAITDASAEVLAKLPAAKQQEFIEACYSKEKGIGFSIARTTIHSCDFSSASYTYVTNNDKELKTFNIEPDKKFRIPLIKRAIETAGGKLTLFASPWSPPAFMKDNNNMLRGGKLLPDYAEAWALYYTKFIKAYEAENIPIWGITIQNEPAAVQPWESCIFSAQEECNFLKNHLGPVMKREGLGNKTITIWDHNRDIMSERVSTILDDPEAAKYVWGVGFHWYETWNGGQPMFDNVKDVHESYPTKNLMFTEGCIEHFDTTKLQSWSDAERFGNSMVHDFNNGTVGWTFWNILLDETGGPNHVGNLCLAPVHGNTVTGELIYTPSYYYIGHFSKYVRPNAKRISATTTRFELITSTFLNEDGSMVTVIVNQSDKKLRYNLYVASQSITDCIMPHAIQTITY